jgi:alcohol dehydrogenase
VRSLRRRGRHLQIGLLGGDPDAGLPWDLVVGQELRVLGSHGMAAVEYPGMLAMITDGRLRPELMVGAVIELDAAGDALMEMDRPVAGRAGIVVATP